MGIIPREQGLADLTEILNRLGPGATLTIDHRWLSHLFDTEVSAAVEAAKEFANRNHCTFMYDKKQVLGKFGRAYFKSDRNG